MAKAKVSTADPKPETVLIRMLDSGVSTHRGTYDPGAAYFVTPTAATGLIAAGAAERIEDEILRTVAIDEIRRYGRTMPEGEIVG